MKFPTTLFKQMHTAYHAEAEARREIIKLSGDVGHSAKRAIFSFQRGDVVQGAALLLSGKETLEILGKKYAKQGNILLKEGSYRAAVEEYMEAILLQDYLSGSALKEHSDITKEKEIYLGALSDVVGELYRLTIRAATEGKEDEVGRHAKASEEILAFLISFDFTGYLRTKFDQAKGARQKIEQVVYELALRSGKKSM